jgi:uncharacterized membrane protein
MEGGKEMSKLGTLKMQISEMLKVRKSLWRGIIFAAPMAIIVWIVYEILNAVNSIGYKLLDLFLPASRLYWGMGVLLILFFVFLIGRIELYYQGRKRNIWQTFKEKTIGKIPFFGPLFARGDKTILSFEDFKRLTPCKFWLSDTTPHYGFIVNEQRVRGAETELDVYRPNVPTLIPGDLFPLKKRYVIKLGNPSGQILDKLASGGLISSQEEIPIPWEDETEEDFRERINLTPLEIAVKRIVGEKFRNPSQVPGSQIL